MGFLISLACVLVLMPAFIDFMKRISFNQTVSEYALDEYKEKAKTPIMGGLLFVVLPVIAFLIVDINSIHDASAMIVLISYVLFCLVGFLDDFLIIQRRDNEGLSPKTKLIMEFIFVLFIFFVFRNYIYCQIDVPFINGGLTLHWLLFLPLLILMYLGEANAVNFTDGMDGLCAGVSFIGLIGFAVICYKGNMDHLFILILCIMGGLLAYLHYNHFPAKIFMGDSGSLALGGLFAALALVTGKEIALLFIGGVFLLEMFCVCLQLSWVKLFGKRILPYTPIHYAFVIKGHKETSVVRYFYILAVILTVIGVIIGLS